MKRSRSTAARLTAVLLLCAALFSAGCEWKTPDGKEDARTSGQVWRLNRAGVSIPVPAAYTENRDLITIAPVETLYPEDGISYGGLILYPAPEEALRKMSAEEQDAISEEISFPVIFFGIDGNRGRDAPRSDEAHLRS